MHRHRYPKSMRHAHRASSRHLAVMSFTQESEKGMELSFSGWRGDGRRGRHSGHRLIPTSAVVDVPVGEPQVVNVPIVTVPVVPIDVQDPRNRTRDSPLWSRAGVRQCLFCSVLVAAAVVAILLLPTSGEVGDLAAHSFTGGSTVNTLPTKSPPFPPPGGIGGYPPPPHPSPPPPPHPPPNVSPPAVPPLPPTPAQPPCATPTEDCSTSALGCCDGFECELTTEVVGGIPNDVYRCAAAPRGPPPPPSPSPRPPPPPSPPEIFHPPPSPGAPPPPSPPPLPAPPTLPPPLPARPCPWHCERFYTSHDETAAQAADRWCHEEVRSGTFQTLNNPLSVLRVLVAGMVAAPPPHGGAARRGVRGPPASGPAAFAQAAARPAGAAAALALTTAALVAAQPLAAALAAAAAAALVQLV